MRVRTCTSTDDAQVLADYGCKLAFETEDKTLDKAIILAGVKDLMVKPKMGVYYLAEIAEEVAADGAVTKWKPVGTTMVTFEMQPRLGGLLHMIQSVYVDAEYRKKGVFRSLYNKVVECAKADPITKAVRLYVDHDNETAMAVYSKLGMTCMDSWAFDEKDFVFSH